VGHQCIDCVHAGRQQQRSQAPRRRPVISGGRTVAGARLADRPLVTPLLVGVNVLVYLVTALQARSPMQNQSSAIFGDGVLWPVGMVADDQWWRLVTSGFLHYGLIHIGMNMLALWILGRDLELLLGRARFLAVYFISMLGGGAAVFLLGDIRSATAGASGAIYGLLGAILIAVLRLRLNPSMAIGIILLNLLLSVSIPGISLLGHLGGLIVGALAMIAIVYAPARHRGAYQAGALVLITVALAGVIAYRDVQLAAQLCNAYRLAC
jgi:membrane associated rhomboid family serine protease